MWDEIYKIKMNHLKIYYSIIKKAKSENRSKSCDIYYENHHIIPKCLSGNNDKENLVLLTSREHYICHKLLTYIYPKNRKIACAYHKMTYGNSNKYIKSSRDYAYAIELIKTTIISEETRIKKSTSLGNILAKQGDINPAKRLDVKQTISKKLKGKFLGEKNPMAKTSRKRNNLKNLENNGIILKGDIHEYLRKKIKCVNIETNEIIIFDGVQELLKILKINKRKYYSHLKNKKPILNKFTCEVLNI